MDLSVHLLQSFDSEFVTRLRGALDSSITLTSGDLPIPANFEILIAGVPEREQLLASPRIQTLVIPWAGLPRRTRELMLEFPQIAVHNLHHNALPTAETALALMFAAVKEIIPIDRKLRQGDWHPRYTEQRAPLLHGRTALILGYGAIGRLIAQSCLALGMKVRATRRTSGSEIVEDGVTIDSAARLADLLPRADVLFLALPSTPETEALLGPAELALLPDGATIVNIARGAIIDEHALYRELASGRLRAGLDVWYNYPGSESERTSTQPSEHPFNQLDNVVMTPHLGGHADRTEDLRIAALARLLNAATHGEPLPDRVDIERGY